MHTVAWDKIYRPRDKGGLGVPVLHHMNIALLVKLLWWLVQQRIFGDTNQLLVYLEKHDQGSFGISGGSRMGSIEWKGCYVLAGYMDWQ